MCSFSYIPPNLGDHFVNKDRSDFAQGAHRILVDEYHSFMWNKAKRLLGQGRPSLLLDKPEYIDGKLDFLNYGAVIPAAFLYALESRMPGSFDSVFHLEEKELKDNFTHYTQRLKSEDCFVVLEHGRPIMAIIGASYFLFYELEQNKINFSGAFREFIRSNKTAQSFDNQDSKMSEQFFNLSAPDLFTHYTTATKMSEQERMILNNVLSTINPHDLRDMTQLCRKVSNSYIDLYHSGEAYILQPANKAAHEI